MFRCSSGISFSFDPRHRFPPRVGVISELKQWLITCARLLADVASGQPPRPSHNLSGPCGGAECDLDFAVQLPLHSIDPSSVLTAGVSPRRTKPLLAERSSAYLSNAAPQEVC